MAMPSNGDGLDQFEEGNAAGGHACEVEAVPYSAVSPSMTFRRFPPPWRVDTIPGGYVVRDASGQALAYIYSRDNEAEARQAKVLTKDEARRVVTRAHGVQAALTGCVELGGDRVVIEGVLAVFLDNMDALTDFQHTLKTFLGHA
jgi:hypothetical protein